MSCFFFNAAVCDEQCSLHGGVCDNGKCEFRCSDYAGYTCQKGSAILPSLSMCHDVLVRDADGQHCAPSELSILQQLEAVVLVPNYNRLMPSGRTFLNFFNNANCAAAAKRLACWVWPASTISQIFIYLANSFWSLDVLSSACIHVMRFCLSALLFLPLNKHSILRAQLTCSKYTYIQERSMYYFVRT